MVCCSTNEGDFRELKKCQQPGNDSETNLKKFQQFLWKWKTFKKTGYPPHPPLDWWTNSRLPTKEHLVTSSELKASLSEASIRRRVNNSGARQGASRKSLLRIRTQNENEAYSQNYERNIRNMVLNLVCDYQIYKHTDPHQLHHLSPVGCIVNNCSKR